MLILWIMSVISISFYGGPVSYGFFTVLTIIPVISILYIFCVILGFKIFQKLDGRNLVSNSTSDFYFTLQNESPIAFAGIRAVFYSSFSTISGLDDSTEYELAPHTGIRKQTELICRYRGEYEVGIKKIMVQDMFRLFSISYKNREPLRVTVRPKTVFLTRLHTMDRIVNNSRDARENMTEPDVLAREYVPGDDVRKIHWRATAAMQKLMTRENIGIRQQQVGIIMNPRRCSSRQEESLPVENKLLEVVIALVLFFAGNGIEAVFFMGQGETDEITVSNMSRFDDFYARISEYVFDEENDTKVFYENALRSGSMSEKRQVFLVTYELAEEEEVLIGELVRNSVTVTVYVIDFANEKAEDLPDIPGCDIVRVATDADLAEVM